MPFPIFSKALQPWHALLVAAGHLFSRWIQLAERDSGGQFRFHRLHRQLPHLRNYRYPLRKGLALFWTTSRIQRIPPPTDSDEGLRVRSPPGSPPGEGERGRARESEGKRGRARESERAREREGETEEDREKGRQRDRETERKGDREKGREKERGRESTATTTAKTGSERTQYDQFKTR